MNDYYKHLTEQFKNLTIDLKHFDNGATPQCMQLKIVVTGFTKAQLKNKGNLVLDLGNYIYNKFGISYEMCPEFDNINEPKNSLTWFISKERTFKQDNLLKFITSHQSELTEGGLNRLEFCKKNKYIFLFQPITIQAGE